MNEVKSGAITRSVSILGALHRNKAGLTLHEISAITGLDQTTIYNELHGMMDRSQVQREPLYADNLHWIDRRKSGQYRYSFTPEFADLVMDLG